MGSREGCWAFTSGKSVRGGSVLYEAKFLDDVAKLGSERVKASILVASIRLSQCRGIGYFLNCRAISMTFVYSTNDNSARLRPISPKPDLAATDMFRIRQVTYFSPSFPNIRSSSSVAPAQSPCLASLPPSLLCGATCLNCFFKILRFLLCHRQQISEAGRLLNASCVC